MMLSYKYVISRQLAQMLCVHLEAFAYVHTCIHLCMSEFKSVIVLFFYAYIFFKHLVLF
jgi:hypothetical protein